MAVPKAGYGRAKLRCNLALVNRGGGAWMSTQLGHMIEFRADIRCKAPPTGFVTGGIVKTGGRRATLTW